MQPNSNGTGRFVLQVDCDFPAGKIKVDAARVEQRDDSDQTSLLPGALEDESAVGRARPGAPDHRGIVIAKYPEWDRAHGVERPEWTTVREVPARTGDPRLVEEALERADVLRNRIRRLVRGVRVGRTICLKRQLDGHDLDVDAVLDAGIALRSRQEPDAMVNPDSKLGTSRNCYSQSGANKERIFKSGSGSMSFFRDNYLDIHRRGRVS